MGMLNLLLAVGAALVRLGWEVPLPNYDLLIAHGSLMVCGFLGTLISLERAVALDRPWAYAAPFLTAAGGLYQVVEPTASLGSLIISLGSLGLVIIFVILIRRHPTLSTACLGLGAVIWLVGNLLWSAGWPLFAVVPWWIGFLLLTIAGERLELSRMLFLSRKAQTAFLVVIGVFLTGACLAAVGFVAQREAQIVATEAGDVFTSDLFDLGARLTGVAMFGLSAWLLRCDISRHTVRQPGLIRFTAICLLSGYGWLGVSGLLGLTFGDIVGGLAYDAVLHTFFLGFVLAMIFGHAPIILPAVLGVPIAFRRTFYTHLILLHLSLALRITSDLVCWLPGRKWGGLLNVFALLFFLVNTRFAVQKPSVTARTAVRGSNKKNLHHLFNHSEAMISREEQKDDSS